MGAIIIRVAKEQCKYAYFSGLELKAGISLTMYSGPFSIGYKYNGVKCREEGQYGVQQSLLFSSWTSYRAH